MVDISEIKSYEAPGALLTKSRETIGSNSSAKIYDNVPKTPPKSNDSESYFHGDEEGANTDSDGKLKLVYTIKVSVITVGILRR